MIVRYPNQGWNVTGDSGPNYKPIRHFSTTERAGRLSIRQQMMMSAV
jgi:hypothetical protein